MKFYWDEDVHDNKTQHKPVDILKEFLNQYYDNFQHLGSDYIKATIQPNMDLLQIVIDEWKDEHEYSVLVCPYYQYPKSNSQIYGQALDGNVCLLSWEHLAFLLDMNVKESKKVNLSSLWNISERIGETVTIKDKNKNSNFHEKGNRLICSDLSVDYGNLTAYFNNHKKSIVIRGESEIKFWEKRIKEINLYTKEKAISELIDALKLQEKIIAIRKYIETLRD